MPNRPSIIDVWKIDLKPKQSSDPFLRKILANYVQQSPEELVVERGEFGKPYLRDFPNCHFNLSHSNEKMLLAISDQPVGIDIEQIKARGAMDALVKKCFALSEQTYWHSTPENEKLTLFYDFWTRKEAVVKGIGRGISLGLNHCEIDTNQRNDFLSLPIDEKWQTYDVETESGYCAAVASPHNNVTVRVFSSLLHNRSYALMLCQKCDS